MSLLHPKRCDNQIETTLTNDHICGRRPDEPAPCSGDSGAPMMCRKRDGSYFILGIVSFGGGSDLDSCPKSTLPYVFTRYALINDQFRHYYQTCFIILQSMFSITLDSSNVFKIFAENCRNKE